MKPGFALHSPIFPLRRAEALAGRRTIGTRSASGSASLSSVRLRAGHTSCATHASAPSPSSSHAGGKPACRSFACAPATPRSAGCRGLASASRAPPPRWRRRGRGPPTRTREDVAQPRRQREPRWVSVSTSARNAAAAIIFERLRSPTPARSPPAGQPPNAPEKASATPPSPSASTHATADGPRWRSSAARPGPPALDASRRPTRASASRNSAVQRRGWRRRRRRAKRPLRIAVRRHPPHAGRSSPRLSSWPPRPCRRLRLYMNGRCRRARRRSPPWRGGGGARGARAVTCAASSRRRQTVGRDHVTLRFANLAIDRELDPPQIAVQ